jgi:hypothetical protein
VSQKQETRQPTHVFITAVLVITVYLYATSLQSISRSLPSGIFIHKSTASKSTWDLCACFVSPHNFFWWSGQVTKELVLSGRTIPGTTSCPPSQHDVILPSRTTNVSLHISDANAPRSNLYNSRTSSSKNLRRVINWSNWRGQKKVID